MVVVKPQANALRISNLVIIFVITNKNLNLRSVTIRYGICYGNVTLNCYVELLRNILNIKNMELSETKCVHCDKSFKPSNKRNLYCSTGCKQEAYRVRNNMESPSFLKSEEDKFQVFKSQGKSIVYREVLTREFTDKRNKIREMNLELSKYKKEKAAIEKKIDRILNRNESWFTENVSGVLASLKVMVTGWIIYRIIKGLNLLKVSEWLILPITVGAILIGISRKKESDEEHDKELSNIGKYRLDLENVVITVKSLELAINNEELILTSINQFEKVTEEETEEIIEKVKQPKGGFPSIRENDAKNIISLRDLQKARFKTLQFTGKWKELMGTPEERFSIMIYGQSGQGKSTFAINFAEYLSNNFGAVLFNSAEEGISLTLQDKLKNLKSNDLFISHHKDFNSMKKHLKSSTCKFVVLDSVNHMNLTPDNVEELRNMDKTRGFISIHQVTKSGEFKGDNKFLHNCDVEIVVDNYTPTTKKSRYRVMA